MLCILVCSRMQTILSAGMAEAFLDTIGQKGNSQTFKYLDIVC